jgi:hypothetical protein
VRTSVRNGLRPLLITALSVGLGAAAGVGLGGASRRDGAPAVVSAPVRSVPPPSMPSLAARLPEALPDGRPLGGRLRVEADPLATAALRAELPWSNAESLYGWGSVRVVGRPREDELMVRVIIDSPTAERRWQSECALSLEALSVEAGAGTIARTARYVGRPMDDGAMYDAIRIDLSIEEVRRLASAESIAGSVCGDPLALGPEQLETLRAFVLQFDELATRRSPGRATETLRAPEDPSLEEEEIWEDAG